MSAKAAWHTLQGRRDTNQDAALVRELADGRLLVAVADGMGGHQGGGEASRRALRTLVEEVEAGRSLSDGVTAANAAVHEEAAREPSRTGMGTTLVALLCERDAYLIANVGDSRAYRIDGDGIRQLTVDHSFAAEAVRKGMTREEIDSSPWRNALTRAIGTDPDVEVDVFGPFPTQGGHSVCLCTDGLYRALSDERIREVVSSARDPHGVAERLTGLAFELGSSDNITVAYLSVGDGVSPHGDGAGGTEHSSLSPGSAADGGGDARTVIEPAPSERPEGSEPGVGRRRRKRKIHLSQKAKVEIWGAAITILLATVLAYVLLNVL